ncbi:MAG: hypothetical protein J0L97_05170 [Alphaproteobacteria bacterium]|nr:hypothetical protein [Alphaproteobacteria bacterium]
MSISWKDWAPGLDNDDFTMNEVLAGMPANNQEEIAFVVRLFENPCSPIAFKGALSLARHDCVHALLGRGLLPQDEAFVIGYTMGTSKTISGFSVWLFKKVTRYIYQKPYNFSDKHLKVYDLGFEEGKKCAVDRIYDYPLEEHKDMTLGELRSLFGIDKDALKQAYKREKFLIPDSKVSKRLPI